MLQGIDVASHQGDINIAAVPSDFVIIKATGGNGYVNPWCDPIMEKVKAAGKRKGVYHFRDDGFGDSGAIAEANFFVDNILGYLDGKTMLVLDWEDGNLGDVAWAKAWLDHVFARTGVKPLIYMSESVVNQFDWSPVVRGDYGLWVAKYGQNTGTPGAEPSISDWPFYIMWQYTSKKRLPGYGGDLDHNIFEGTAAVWDAYCTPIHQKPPVIPQPPVVINDPVVPKPVEPTPTPPQPQPEPNPTPDLPSEPHTPPQEPSKPDSSVDEPSEPEKPSQGFLDRLNNISFGPYSKAIVAVVGALGTWVTVAISDGNITGEEISGLGVAILTALGVYQVRNKK